MGPAKRGSAGLRVYVLSLAHDAYLLSQERVGFHEAVARLLKFATLLKAEPWRDGRPECAFGAKHSLAGPFVLQVRLSML